MTYGLSDIYIGYYINLIDVLTDSEFNGGKDTLVDFNTKKLIFISIFKIIFLINRQFIFKFCYETNIRILKPI